jgi:hypothetical protein
MHDDTAQSIRELHLFTKGRGRDVSSQNLQRQYIPTINKRCGGIELDKFDERRCPPVAALIIQSGSKNANNICNTRGEVGRGLRLGFSRILRVTLEDGDCKATQEWQSRFRVMMQSCFRRAHISASSLKEG